MQIIASPGGRLIYGIFQSSGNGAKYFTTLDLFSGFWQVSLDEESIHMTYT